MQDGQKPDGPTETPGEALRRIVAAAAGQGLAPLDILRRLHAALGEVPPAGPAVVADATGRSRAEIRLLVSARTELRTPAAGASRDMARGSLVGDRPRILRVCRAESCRSMGADRLLAALRARWGAAPQGAGASGAPDAAAPVRVEIVHCLSLCAAAPSVSLDGRAVARMTPARLEEILRRAGVPPVNGGGKAGGGAEDYAGQGSGRGGKP